MNMEKTMKHRQSSTLNLQTSTQSNKLGSFHSIPYVLLRPWKGTLWYDGMDEIL